MQKQYTLRLTYNEDEEDELSMTIRVTEEEFNQVLNIMDEKNINQTLAYDLLKRMKEEEN